MAVANSSAARHNLALVALEIPTGKAVRQTIVNAAATAGDDLLSVVFGLSERKPVHRRQQAGRSYSGSKLHTVHGADCDPDG